ncbi:MAG: D-glycero-beta-D-manno-heptose 1-phosphate adenylyltransferase [Arenicellales bacterium]|nr:D-glycero-beta-D-manno-heptose 1-phosphate adenylyltransferase [Gammaproteobacteria bacterium]NDA13640.1 D-glycero-beta-D-manno-heptose 1-phosphate adenylyltransferase [Gammaproteobacteria bacterium]NDG43199.1 D-glycero-beta-D-manno-heptose 1-phosphate adenylyltransferase [Gammaproteobacteria bacterium]
MNSADKIVLDTKRLVENLTGDDRPVVFTNGCFDILHRGHVSYLETAAKLGNTLVVALNSDSSVQTLGKGANRPVNTLDDRMAVVAALACVDWVTFFDQPTPIDLILALKPDRLVKGGDWAVEHIVGAAEVIASGGSVHSVPVEFDRSTSAIIERIRR